ncbi:hypothetical protein CPB84DRAFT_1963963, partial [Gymnopilus junonius]
MNQFQQAAQEGLCLRYPDSIPQQREITYETAVNLLLRGTAMAATVPFSWSYIDKPSDGTLLLLYLPLNSPFPIDGVRYQESEFKFTIPAGPRELEIHEIKYGFIPGSADSNASRVRRRYRLLKGGSNQFVLVHYTRGPVTHIPPALMHQPTRAYPLRPINEPSVYVSGDKLGQKAFPPGPMHGASGRRERERERERAAQRADPAAGRPPQQRVVEDEDSGDEVDQISTRTLALTRYKRNHEWMNEVFHQAAFGKSFATEPKPSPYSIFSKSDLEEKTTKLQAELEALQSKSAQQKQTKSVNLKQQSQGT